MTGRVQASVTVPGAAWTALLPSAFRVRDQLGGHGRRVCPRSRVTPWERERAVLVLGGFLAQTSSLTLSTASFAALLVVFRHADVAGAELFSVLFSQ